MFQKKQGLSFDNGFTQALSEDEAALRRYMDALSRNVPQQQAFDTTMRSSSAAAQNFANSLDVMIRSEQQAEAEITKFTAQQRMAEVSAMTSSKSFASVRLALNEYRGGLQNCGLNQQQFIEAVGQSNPVLAKYLSNVEVGKGSMAGYTMSLVGAKLATVGLRIATMALNAVIGVGIGLIVSFITSGIQTLIENIKNSFKSTEEKLKDVNEKIKETTASLKEISDSFKSLKQSSDDVIPRFEKLAKGVDKFGENVSLTDEEYKEFLELNNKIAEMFPELNLGMDDNGNAMLALSYNADTLTKSLKELLEVQRQQANQDLADKLPELASKYSDKRDLLNDEIEAYKKDIEDFQWLFNNDTKTLNGLSKKDGKIYLPWSYYPYPSDPDKTKYGNLLTSLGISHKSEKETGHDYAGDYQERVIITINESPESLNRKIDDYVSGIERKINSKKKEIENTWASITPSLQGWLATNSTFNTFDKDMQNVATTMLNSVNWSDINPENDADFTNYIETHILNPLSSASPEVKNAFVELFTIEPSEFSSLDAYENKVIQTIRRIADSSEEFDYNSMWENYGFYDTFKQYNDMVNGIVAKMPDVSKSMVRSLSTSEIKEAFEVSKNGIMSSYGELVNYIRNKKISDAISEDVETIGKSLDNLQKTFNSVLSVAKDYNKNGYYSIDNLQTLLELEPEYLRTLINEKGQIDLNSTAYKEYAIAKTKSLVLGQIETLFQHILGMNAEAASAYAAAEAYGVEAGSLENLTSALISTYFVQARLKDATEGTVNVYTNAFKKSLQSVANYVAMGNSVIQSISGSTNEFTEALDNNANALKEQKKELEAQKKALENYKKGLDTAQDSLQDLIDLVVEYLKKQKEDEKEALEDQKKAYDEIIDKKKEALKLAKEEKETNDEIADKQNALAKSKLAYSISGLDDSSAGKKAQKQARDNVISSEKDLRKVLADNEYDIRIKALEAEQEAFDKNIEDQTEAIDKYLKNSRQLYEDACRLIEKDTGKLYNDLWTKYVYPHTTKTRAEFNKMWGDAQTALQKYKGENDTLLGVMERLQGEIYTTDKKIDILNTSLDATSTAISSISDSISSVSASLGGLGDSVADYLKKINGDFSTKFSVYHNGKVYTTKEEYFGDTEGNRYLAAAELAKQIEKDSGYSPSLLATVESYLGAGTQSRQWYFDYGGKKYTWVSKSQETAIKNIMKWMDNPKVTEDMVRKGIKHYATGTYGAEGGLSVTQEGVLETIFGKLKSGQYTMLNQGSHVFNGDATQNLHKFADNPSRFIAEHSYGNYLSSQYGNAIGEAMVRAQNEVHNSRGDTVITAPISINIQGDATQSTVNALKREAEKIKNDTIKTVFHYANYNKRPLS